MQRNFFFSFSMCIFYNATFFFLAMHICYDTNLLDARRKRSTLTSSFLLQHKKKIVSSYCMFFDFFFATIFHLFVACNRLVTWNKNTHASFYCYNISYIIIIFVFLFNSFVFLVAMLLDASLNSPQGREMNPQMTIMELR
jgi:hypothetical protein